jgi:hypothetical protein
VRAGVNEPYPTSPRALFASLWDNRELIAQLTRCEVLSRYRGSILGLAWSFFNPLLMLAVYTFVFSVVCRVRQPGAGPHPRQCQLRQEGRVSARNPATATLFRSLVSDSSNFTGGFVISSESLYGGGPRC